MKKKISIEGMSCGHCVAHVEEALKELGANSINVSLEKKSAEAEVGTTSDEKIKEAIEDAGYDVIGIESI
ncbi:copper chaperone CopZ [Clostridium pasteurianum DSM 525 = ATCC 6013]|uniref:Copper chaperone CopZ n=1 Tax=Clostridium pasteurianum DSM 525 = ATCC 6013 TaxID=1262449 RepID=A0A0H3J7X0_CLOPA|nr:copper ion binding protein [Clostridium pasteurianum]AJA49297.1 copper chaperone CopZ [Clostridium pasteurianum DSM 525 = ATCC 6013]AJA53285.1 copper chaperone CopZ [Clostridium pasteurianum DSM 525 = ATCC 6013]AOZ76475.1 heavy metal transport/detoxification protein [Clostridium pasteurianum DSM 525 = ATCC 6013]AOZ80272.1 heavy metal transport/detoxification protein [Clostridium pasteurianum]ELP58317.1 Heavy-metal binding protein [Clostridium pasteurianum DSM 525 = ATCC 6013]